MKYMLLIYSSPATWAALSQEDREQMGRDHAELVRELQESGEWVDGNALADPSQSTSVKARDGLPVTTDGPFAETRDHLAGYDLVDCATPERAAEIAARIPDAKILGVEIRPIMDVRGMEL